MITDELYAKLKLKTYKGLDCIYNTDATASDGTILCGRGVTEKQSIEDAGQRLLDFELFLCKPPREQLQEILSSHQQGRLLQLNQERCIRLLAEIILQDDRVRGSK